MFFFKQNQTLSEFQWSKFKRQYCAVSETALIHSNNCSKTNLQHSRGKKQHKRWGPSSWVQGGREGRGRKA